MRVHKLADMRGGWFVGQFQPSVLRLSECEVAVKRYRAGDREAAHVHRLATELTLVVSGRVTMNGQAFGEGDIVELAPGEPAEFHVLEDAITVVVKSPSVPSDKHPV
jgi:quercetin dioxygenase-like cupin family protein